MSLKRGKLQRVKGWGVDALLNISSNSRRHIFGWKFLSLSPLLNVFVELFETNLSSPQAAIAALWFRRTLQCMQTLSKAFIQHRLKLCELDERWSPYRAVWEAVNIDSKLSHTGNFCQVCFSSHNHTQESCDDLKLCTFRKLTSIYIFTVPLICPWLCF